jgi:hypothetical protein
MCWDGLMPMKLQKKSASARWDHSDGKVPSLRIFSFEISPFHAQGNRMKLIPRFFQPSYLKRANFAGISPFQGFRGFARQT